MGMDWIEIGFKGFVLWAGGFVVCVDWCMGEVVSELDGGFWDR